MNDLAGLMALVASTRPANAWPSLEKCQTLAAMVVAQRPRLVVELGVWTGDSLIPQLLALSHVSRGTAIAIDPWSADASVEGQVDQANVEWWGRQDIHERAFQTFCQRVQRGGFENICEVLRMKSDDVDVAAIGEIDLLHVDANHGDNAIRDVDRFARRIPIGGTLIMDDCQWSGGAVLRAYDLAVSLGFCERYDLGTGCVLQRVRA